jgi:acyl-CoA thioesterase-1
MTTRSIFILALAAWLLAGSAFAQSNATILVMGDSISAAYGIQREEGWVTLLEERLSRNGQPWRVVNASISGETTAGGLARLPKALDTHKPQLVIIELGGNDGLRGYPIKRIQHNLAAMVELAQSDTSRVLLVGMQIPPNYGPRYTREFADIFKHVAAATDSQLVPFLLEDVVLIPELMQDDGIHPKAQAQPMLLDTLWAYLQPLLQDS